MFFFYRYSKCQKVVQLVLNLLLKYPGKYSNPARKQSQRYNSVLFIQYTKCTLSSLKSIFSLFRLLFEHLVIDRSRSEKKRLFSSKKTCMQVGQSLIRISVRWRGGGGGSNCPPPPRILKEGKKKGTEQREEREKYEGQMRKEAKSKNC